MPRGSVAVWSPHRGIAEGYRPASLRRRPGWLRWPGWTRCGRPRPWTGPPSTRTGPEQAQGDLRRKRRRAKVVSLLRGTIYQPGMKTAGRNAARITGHNRSRTALAGREEITLGLHAGDSFTVIAARLGKAVFPVSREVATNGGREGYWAWRAHQRAREQARRPKAPKLAHPVWRSRSPGGCRNGGRRSRSRAGCGSSFRAIHDACESRDHLLGAVRAGPR